MRWVCRFPGLVLVLVLVGLCCAPACGNAFAYDDLKVVQARGEDGASNPMVGTLRPWTSYFVTEYWTGAGDQNLRSNPLYRPVTVLSFAWTHALFPGDGTAVSEARPHHLVNLLLHLLNTVLVFLLARLVWTATDSRGPIVAAAAFGFAGIHAEAVAALVGRAELLAFAAGATAVLLERRGAVAASGMRCGLCLLPAALALFIAMGAKESGVAWWPFLVCFALADRRRIGPVSWRVGVVPLLLGVVPFGAWLALRASAFAGLAEPLPVAFVVNPLRDLDLGTRCVEALMVWGYGITQTVVPWHLSSDYGASVLPFVPPGEHWLSGLPYLLVWLGVLLGCAWAWRRRHAQAFLGCAAVLGFGFVTSNTLVLIGTVWAERLQYAPSLGVAWLVAVGVVGARSLPGPQRRVVVAVFGLWLAGNAIALARRCGDWKDDPTRIAADVASTPDSLMLRLQAAVLALRGGDEVGWREHLEAARRIEPGWGRPAIELAAGMVQRAAQSEGDAATRASALDAAEALLREAEQAPILEADERRMAWRNLGQVRLRRGDPVVAMTWYRRLLTESSAPRTRHEVLTDLAAARATAAWREVLEEGEALISNAPVWGLHRGLEATRRQDWDVARRALEAALPLVPLWDAAVQNAWIVLGELRLKAGDAPGAQALFRSIAGDARFAQTYRSAAAARLR